MVRSHVVPLPCTSPILLTSPRLALSYYGQQAQCLGAKRLVIAPATVLTSDWEEEGYEFSPYDLQQLAEYHQNRKGRSSRAEAGKRQRPSWQQGISPQQHASTHVHPHHYQAMAVTAQSIEAACSWSGLAAAIVSRGNASMDVHQLIALLQKMISLGSLPNTFNITSIVQQDTQQTPGMQAFQNRSQAQPHPHHAADVVSPNPSEAYRNRLHGTNNSNVFAKLRPGAADAATVHAAAERALADITSGGLNVPGQRHLPFGLVSELLALGPAAGLRKAGSYTPLLAAALQQVQSGTAGDMSSTALGASSQQEQQFVYAGQHSQQNASYDDDIGGLALHRKRFMHGSAVQRDVADVAEVATMLEQLILWADCMPMQLLSPPTHLHTQLQSTSVTRCLAVTGTPSTLGQSTQYNVASALYGIAELDMQPWGLARALFQALSQQLDTAVSMQAASAQDAARILLAHAAAGMAPSASLLQALIGSIRMQSLLLTLPQSALLADAVHAAYAVQPAAELAHLHGELQEAVHAGVSMLNAADVPQILFELEGSSPLLLLYHKHAHASMQPPSTVSQEDASSADAASDSSHDDNTDSSSSTTVLPAVQLLLCTCYSLLLPAGACATAMPGSLQTQAEGKSLLEGLHRPVLLQLASAISALQGICMPAALLAAGQAAAGADGHAAWHAVMHAAAAVLPTFSPQQVMQLLACTRRMGAAVQAKQPHHTHSGSGQHSLMEGSPIVHSSALSVDSPTFMQALQDYAAAPKFIKMLDTPPQEGMAALQCLAGIDNMLRMHVGDADVIHEGASISVCSGKECQLPGQAAVQQRVRTLQQHALQWQAQVPKGKSSNSNSNFNGHTQGLGSNANALIAQLLLLGEAACSPSTAALFSLEALAALVQSLTVVHGRLQSDMPATLSAPGRDRYGGGRRGKAGVAPLSDLRQAASARQAAAFLPILVSLAAGLSAESIMAACSDVGGRKAGRSAGGAEQLQALHAEQVSARDTAHTHPLMREHVQLLLPMLAGAGDQACDVLMLRLLQLQAEQALPEEIFAAALTQVSRSDLPALQLSQGLMLLAQHLGNRTGKGSPSSSSSRRRGSHSAVMQLQCVAAYLRLLSRVQGGGSEAVTCLSVAVSSLPPADVIAQGRNDAHAVFMKARLVEVGVRSSSRTSREAATHAWAEACLDTLLAATQLPAGMVDAQLAFWLADTARMLMQGTLAPAQVFASAHDSAARVQLLAVVARSLAAVLTKHVNTDMLHIRMPTPGRYPAAQRPQQRADVCDDEQVVWGNSPGRQQAVAMSSAAEALQAALRGTLFALLQLLPSCLPLPTASVPDSMPQHLAAPAGHTQSGGHGRERTIQSKDNAPGGLPQELCLLLQALADAVPACSGSMQAMQDAVVRVLDAMPVLGHAGCRLVHVEMCLSAIGAMQLKPGGAWVRSASGACVSDIREGTVYSAAALAVHAQAWVSQLLVPSVQLQSELLRPALPATPADRTHRHRGFDLAVSGVHAARTEEDSSIDDVSADQDGSSLAELDSGNSSSSAAASRQAGSHRIERSVFQKLLRSAAVWCMLAQERHFASSQPATTHAPADKHVADPPAANSADLVMESPLPLYCMLLEEAYKHAIPLAHPSNLPGLLYHAGQLKHQLQHAGIAPAKIAVPVPYLGSYGLQQHVLQCTLPLLPELKGKELAELVWGLHMLGMLPGQGRTEEEADGSVEWQAALEQALLGHGRLQSLDWGHLLLVLQACTSNPHNSFELYRGAEHAHAPADTHAQAHSASASQRLARVLSAAVQERMHALLLQACGQLSNVQALLVHSAGPDHLANNNDFTFDKKSTVQGMTHGSPRGSRAASMSQAALQAELQQLSVGPGTLQARAAYVHVCMLGQERHHEGLPAADVAEPTGSSRSEHRLPMQVATAACALHHILHQMSQHAGWRGVMLGMTHGSVPAWLDAAMEFAILSMQMPSSWWSMQAHRPLHAIQSATAMASDLLLPSLNCSFLAALASVTFSVHAQQRIHPTSSHRGGGLAQGGRSSMSKIRPSGMHNGMMADSGTADAAPLDRYEDGRGSKTHLGFALALICFLAPSLDQSLQAHKQAMKRATVTEYSEAVRSSTCTAVRMSQMQMQMHGPQDAGAVAEVLVALVNGGYSTQLATEWLEGAEVLMQPQHMQPMALASVMAAFAHMHHMPSRAWTDATLEALQTHMLQPASSPATANASTLAVTTATAMVTAQGQLSCVAPEQTERGTSPVAAVAAAKPKAVAVAVAWLPTFLCSCVQLRVRPDDAWMGLALRCTAAGSMLLDVHEAVSLLAAISALRVQTSKALVGMIGSALSRLLACLIQPTTFQELEMTSQAGATKAVAASTSSVFPASVSQGPLPAKTAPGTAAAALHKHSSAAEGLQPANSSAVLQLSASEVHALLLALRCLNPRIGPKLASELVQAVAHGSLPDQVRSTNRTAHWLPEEALAVLLALAQLPGVRQAVIQGSDAEQRRLLEGCFDVALRHANAYAAAAQMTQQTWAPTGGGEGGEGLDGGALGRSKRGKGMRQKELGLSVFEHSGAGADSQVLALKRARQALLVHGT